MKCSLRTLTSANKLSLPGKKYIFLEGGAGVGKSSLCDVLARKYPVHFESFVELCNEHKEYDPGGIMMSFKWSAKIIERMEAFSRDPAHSIIFFDRSLYTPYVFSRTNANLSLYIDLMRELKQTYNCSVVLCVADAHVIRDRLWDRYNRGTAEEKQIRMQLNELNEEFLDKIRHRYETLNKQGAFSLKFDTSHGTVEELAEKLVGLHM